MPEKVSYKWTKGLAVFCASLISLSGCSAAGVMPAGTDALRNQNASAVESALDELPGKPEYDASLALLWVVSGEYSLPKSYEPADLEEIGGVKLALPAAEALSDLQRGMDIDGGGKLVILQGYRSGQEQEKALEQRTAYYQDQGYSAARAETFAQYDCGPVGSDAYQTGLIVKVGAQEGGLESQKAGEWLRSRAADYGFQVSFDGENAVLRYVGPFHAAAMRQLSVDFDGYIAYLDAYRQCLFTWNGEEYKAEIVSDLSILQGETVSICGDNRGGYIAVSIQEGSNGHSGG